MFENAPAALERAIFYFGSKHCNHFFGPKSHEALLVIGLSIHKDLLSNQVATHLGQKKIPYLSLLIQKSVLKELLRNLNEAEHSVNWV